MPLDPVRLLPFQDRVRGQFRAVAANGAQWLSRSHLEDAPLQLSCASLSFATAAISPAFSSRR
jgi:hypothetical protein